MCQVPETPFCSVFVTVVYPSIQATLLVLTKIAETGRRSAPRIQAVRLHCRKVLEKCAKGGTTWACSQPVPLLEQYPLLLEEPGCSEKEY